MRLVDIGAAFKEAPYSRRFPSLGCLDDKSAELMLIKVIEIWPICPANGYVSPITCASSFALKGASTSVILVALVHIAVVNTSVKRIPVVCRSTVYTPVMFSPIMR